MTASRPQMKDEVVSCEAVMPFKVIEWDVLRVRLVLPLLVTAPARMAWIWFADSATPPAPVRCRWSRPAVKPAMMSCAASAVLKLNCAPPVPACSQLLPAPPASVAAPDAPNK